MNIFRLALELFIIYILYKFIFELVIPLYRGTRRMKDDMANMQEKMRQQNKSAPATQETVSHPAKEDYIEYEEIK